MASHIKRTLGIIAVTFCRNSHKKYNLNNLFRQACKVAAQLMIRNPHATQESGGFARL